MNYLTRPVLETPPDWSRLPAKAFTMDLREQELGFGAPFYNRLQTYVTQGWQLGFTLPTPADLMAFDEFFEALFGPLRGFWLPAPLRSMQIAAAISATQFEILNQGLTATWNQHPDIYLWFTRGEAAGRPAKISNVVDLGGGRERVTLTAGIDPAPVTADVVCRLHYVRLAKDEEAGEFLAEGVMSRELRVIELPHEYEAFETGEQPIYLYHFSAGVPMDRHWRYTSFAADVVSGNQLFASFPMTHGALKKSARLENETLTLKARHDAAHPLALMLPIPFARPLTLEISQCTLADPDTAVVLFTGTVRRAPDAGDTLSADADSWTNILSRKVPPMLIQKEDNYDIYDELTGNVKRWRFEITATVVAAAPEAQPPTVTVTFNNPGSSQYVKWITEDWFAGGFIEAGFGTAFAVRTILSSVALDGTDPVQLRLTVNDPLDVAPGSELQVIPGYDGTADQRRDKYNDFVNFGGFLAVPEKNPSLKAIDQDVSQGGKK